MPGRTLQAITPTGQRFGVVRHRPAYTELTVPSSKSDHAPHTVVMDADGARCTCKGYLFRKTCRHSRLALTLTSQDN